MHGVALGGRDELAHLFQAICRVNRLDTEDKEYGYIVDYKDLFQSLQAAVQDYTAGAFDG